MYAHHKDVFYTNVFRHYRDVICATKLDQLPILNNDHRRRLSKMSSNNDQSNDSILSKDEILETFDKVSKELEKKQKETVDCIALAVRNVDAIMAPINNVDKSVESLKRQIKEKADKEIASIKDKASSDVAKVESKRDSEISEITEKVNKKKETVIKKSVSHKHKYQQCLATHYKKGPVTTSAKKGDDYDYDSDNPEYNKRQGMS